MMNLGLSASDDIEAFNYTVNGYLEYICKILEWIFPDHTNKYIFKNHLTFDLYCVSFDIKMDSDQLVIKHGNMFEERFYCGISIATPDIEDVVVCAIRNILIGSRIRCSDNRHACDTWFVYRPRYSTHELFLMLGVPVNSTSISSTGLITPTWDDYINIFSSEILIIDSLHSDDEYIAFSNTQASMIEASRNSVPHRPIDVAIEVDKKFCEDIVAKRKPSDLLGGLKCLINWERGADHFVRPAGETWLSYILNASGNLPKFCR